ncbi:MAG: hypothetical protein U0T81_01605 [Saprospiraceae bacterium]
MTAETLSAISLKRCPDNGLGTGQHSDERFPRCGGWTRAGMNQNTTVDRLIMSITTILYAIPSYVSSLLVALIFAFAWENGRIYRCKEAFGILMTLAMSKYL